MTVKELREKIEEMKKTEAQLDKLFLTIVEDKRLNQECTIKAQLSETVDDLLSYTKEALREEIDRLEKVMDNTEVREYIE